MNKKYLWLIMALSCSNANAKVSFDLGGRMEVDYTYFDDQSKTLAQEDYDVRRFRFGLFAKYNDKFSAYFQSDFADYVRKRKGATQAAWFRYRHNSNNEIYLGKMEMPFSLESVSNSKYHFFMERSIASAISERYGTGLTYIHYGKTWNMRLGVFGDDHFDLGSSSMYGKAITSRVGKKFKIFNSKLYLGTSAEYREPETVQSIRTLPESHTFNNRLLDTGELFFVKSIQKAGIEALWKKKSWTLQTEYIQNKFNREFGNNLDYDSGYFLISKIFNGRRIFSYKKGEWTATKVKNWKTWEIAARYSFLDLRDSDLNAGFEENISLGINYYLSQKNRVMFNYINAKARPDSFGNNNTFNIYQIRFQLEF